ncbi:hypothetical protein OC844_004400 [Tilletia horrida]|nr:hypothetical protein OC844_004400 [Tilletia horrida]
MANRNGNPTVHLGPPSPSSPVSPTTPSALVPASRDFLVPIGSTGALQKFSVANAAQKRKTAADRRAQAQAQAQAHMAAAEAGWSSLEVEPPVRAASSLGTAASSISGFGSSRGLTGAPAPIEVYHRPSSASGYTPKSATMSSNLSHGGFSSNSALAGSSAYFPSSGSSSSSRPSAARIRTVSGSATATSTGGASSASSGWKAMKPMPADSSTNGHFPPSAATLSQSGSTHSSNAPPPPPATTSEKKRTFTKGLRGLFSSSSTRKASISSAQNPLLASASQHQHTSSSSGSGHWGSSSASSASPFGGTLTSSPDTSEHGRWSAASSSASKSHSVDPYAMHASSSTSSRSPSRSSYAAQQAARASTLGRETEFGQSEHRSRSSHSRHDSQTTRKTEQQRARANTRDLPPLPDQDADSDPRSSDPFSSSHALSKSSRPHTSGDSSGSTPSTPLLGGGSGTSSRRQSMGPPKLDFNLPSPGLNFDEHDRPMDGGGLSPRSRSGTIKASPAGTAAASLDGGPLTSATMGTEQAGVGGSSDRSARRNSRAALIAKQHSLTIDSSASYSGIGRADDTTPREPRTGSSWVSSEPSTASLEFNPGPQFGLHTARATTPERGGAPLPPSVIRSPPTPIHDTPNSDGSGAVGLSPPTPADSSHRSSVSSSLSQATSIVAMTKGWHVEPDVNPPVHPSVIYGSGVGAGAGMAAPRTSPSIASLRSQDSNSRPGSAGLPRDSASSPPAVPSDGRTSVASTVNRAGSATPLGRPFSAASTIAGPNGSNANNNSSSSNISSSVLGPPLLDPFGANSPNPLLAPLFENFSPNGSNSGTGTDDSSSSGVFRSRHGSFDSGTHGHSNLSHGAQGNSTIGHGTMGHGSALSGHGPLFARSAAAAGTAASGSGDDGSLSGAGSAQSHVASAHGHPQSSGSSFATASSGHGGLPSRRPGSSGGTGAPPPVTGGSGSGSGSGTGTGTGTGTGKSGRPTTPRGGVAASAEQPPSALRTAPASNGPAAGPSIPARSKDRGRPGTGNSTTSAPGIAATSATGSSAPAVAPGSGVDTGAAAASPLNGGDSNSNTLSLPNPDAAMLATLAKLESAQAGSTASPLNFATFTEAGLRDALANGGIDVDAARERERHGRSGSRDDGDDAAGTAGASAGAADAGKQGDADAPGSSAMSGASSARSAVASESASVQSGAGAAGTEGHFAKPAMLNGLPVPEGVDPKTYVPPNALTRTRRGAQVGATAKQLAQKAAATAKATAGVSFNGGLSVRSQGRFSLDSDDAEGTRDIELDTRDGAAGAAASAAAAAALPPPPSVVLLDAEEEEEDLSSIDGNSDEDDAELEQLSSTSARNTSVDSSSNTTPRGVTPAVDSQMPANAWIEVEAALKRFQEDGAGLGSSVDSANGAAAAAAAAAAGVNDKGTLLRTILLPFLALEVETPNVEVLGPSKFSSGKARRALFFEWIRSLLVELQQTQTSADRGAILESIGCVLESRNLAARVLDRDAQDLEEFNSIFGIILGWAIGELNKKGVYQNTLIFTGRLLAVAFFRIPGVASKLLRALPVNRFALERISSEAEWDLTQPRSFERYRKRFPVHLQEFCFQDARSYLKMLDGQTPPGLIDADADDDRYLVRQDEVEVEMAGNWLRRWQSDDSELFFSFIRSYHRQMATMLMSTKRLRKISKWYFGGPGYAHLATSVHQKCLSMVHREIFSVTTLSSQKTFNPGETANVLSGSTAGKPRHLEAANRRCTAIVVEIARTGNANTNTQLFSNMLGVHVKSVVKRTSLYDAEGVFCLLDWLDGIISHMDAAELPVDGLLDVDFVIDTVSMLLNTADHALALMRTIAFCYSNFGVLTGHKDTRLRFCERILLEPSVFHKLFLSWSVTIRAYFLHLLVFRLARISDFPNPKADPEGKTAVQVARLFNQRLDEIRRRYEELSPAVQTDNPDEDDDFARFKNRPSSFVSTIKHTPSIHRQESMSKAERILGIGLPDPAMAAKPGADTGKQSLAAKWLRGLGSKSKKNRWSGAKGAVGMTDADNPTVNNEPRRKMLALDELEFDDAELGGDSDSDTEDPPPPASSSSSSSGLGGEGVNGADSVSDVRAMAPAEGAAAVADPDIGLGDNITPDASFDLQSAAPTLASGGPGRPGASPRVSRAFSKRSSILPGPAFDLMGEEGGEDAPAVPPLPAHLQHPYDKNLHTYAVQSLTEYERTIQEHDQYFAAQPESEKAQVPRLQVNWPAMWQD